MEPGHGAGVHPLELLPEDVWPSVAAKLEDSADILNLIEVVPGLGEWLQCKKRLWLLDQVIPHVARFLKRNELLCCRQVCKKWSHAVDNFLDNHPTLRPYSHEHPVTGQIWRYGGWSSRIQDQDFPLQPLRLGNPERITNFLRSMERPSTWRSPIVNRGLLIALIADNNGRLWNGSMDVLRRFGEHIWFLSVGVRGRPDLIVQSRSLVELLGHLPNLKSLKVVWIGGDQEEEWEGIEEPAAEAEEIPQELEQPEQDPDVAAISPEEPQSLDQVVSELFQFPPALPHLETLVLHGYLPDVMEEALLTTFTDQVRRLSIVYWKPDYPTRFPNLTELQLSYMSRWGCEDIKQLLHDLDLPLLSSLEVWLYDTSRITVSTDIVPWLRRYPLLRSLILHGTRNLARETVSPTKACSFPFLNYLNVGKNFLGNVKDFLLCFPNLECLHVEGCPRLPERAAGKKPRLKIWEHVKSLSMYESNVWELLRKLRLITVRCDQNSPAPPRPPPAPPANVEEEEHRQVQFKRETYEHLKKMAGVGGAAN